MGLQVEVQSLFLICDSLTSRFIYWLFAVYDLLNRSHDFSQQTESVERIKSHNWCIMGIVGPKAVSVWTKCLSKESDVNDTKPPAEAHSLIHVFI